MKTKTKLSAFGVGGLVVAFGIAAVLVGSGFQEGPQKVGVVDLERVIRESKLAGELQIKLSVELARRQDILDFLESNKVMTMEQGNQIVTLSLLESPTEDEKQRLENVKQEVKAATEEYMRLNELNPPSEAERALLMQYGGLFRDTTRQIEALGATFQRSLQEIEIDAQNDAVKQAYDSTEAIAKKGAYTVVYSRTAAAYAANDVTEEVIAHVDSQ